jgi:hypothetical protein
MNCLELNIDKCKIISSIRSKNPIIFNYKFYNNELIYPIKAATVN